MKSPNGQEFPKKKIKGEGQVQVCERAILIW